VSGESRENGQRHTACLNTDLGEQEPIEVGARKDFGVWMRHNAVPDIDVAHMVTKRPNAILYWRQRATSACTLADCSSAVAMPDGSHPTWIARGGPDTAPNTTSARIKKFCPVAFLRLVQGTQSSI
jgi:hypothetical protein